MRRKITREIFIEIETIRVTRKRSLRKNTAQPPNRETAARDDSFDEINARLKNRFDKFLKGEF